MQIHTTNYDEAFEQIAKEFKLVALRETPLPADMLQCDTPETAARYWYAQISTHPYFNASVENFAVSFLNTRRRCTGHVLVSQGTQDTLLVHPREVFRAAILAGAASIVLYHNHPSGEGSPSEADIKVTRDLMRAGQMLKIEVTDHLIMCRETPGYKSLRELGYFYA